MLPQVGLSHLILCGEKELGLDLEAAWLFCMQEALGLILIPSKAKSKSQRVCTIGKGVGAQEGKDKLH